MGTTSSTSAPQNSSQSPTSVVLLGVAQDGGVPQAGCVCTRCMAVLNGTSPELYPVSLGITDAQGEFHLVEASRCLARQLHVWQQALNLDELPIPKSVTLTHMHLGHVDGLGQFGKEVMNQKDIRLITSEAVLDELKRRGRTQLQAFNPRPVHNEDSESKQVNEIELGPGILMELHRVPHRDEEGIGDMHAVLIRASKCSLLFLPDHDTWKQTLELHNADSIRSWFHSLRVDVVLLDGTFWSLEEIGRHKRDYESIPHPPISQTIELLGPKRNDDKFDIYFIHLNHTNPTIDDPDIQRRITEKGWGIGKQGQMWKLG